MLDREKKKTVEEKQFVIFSIGSEEFGVDISEVREIIRMDDITRIPNTQECIKGVINLRGGIVAIMDLSMKLGLPTGKETKDTRIIVIEVGKNTVGMIVDSAKEVLRVSGDKIKPAPPILVQKIRGEYLQGVAILGNRLLILLDLAKVIESNDLKEFEGMKKAEAANKTKEETPAQKDSEKTEESGGNKEAAAS